MLSLTVFHPILVALGGLPFCCYSMSSKSGWVEPKVVGAREPVCKAWRHALRGGRTDGVSLTESVWVPHGIFNCFCWETILCCMLWRNVFDSLHLATWMCISLVPDRMPRNETTLCIGFLWHAWYPVGTLRRPEKVSMPCYVWRPSLQLFAQILLTEGVL